jgi:hypothetical protein
MHLILIIAVHLVVSSIATVFIAPRSMTAVATGMSLQMLCLASALICAAGFFATAAYLSRRIRLVSAALVGLLCGVLCSVVLGLSTVGVDYSLITYLSILAPTLLAVLLASLLDRPRSGWQT